MNPIVVIAGLVVALLAVIYAWTGLALAWGIVMFLCVVIVGLVVLWIHTLPRWPG